MNVRVRATLVTEPSSRAVVITAPPDTPWDDVLRVLSEETPGIPAVDGTPLEPHMLVGHPPLLDGCTIEPARPQAEPARSPLLAVVESGPCQTRSVPLTPGTHEIGRFHPLLGDDNLASRRHAEIAVHHGEVSVRDLGSANGARIDGRDLADGACRPWRVGERLCIGASTIRLTMADEASASCVPDGRGHLKSPAVRHRPAVRPLELSWPAELPAPSRTPVRWVALLAPVPVAALMAYVMDSAIMLCLMAFGPLAMLLTVWDDRRAGRSSSRRARAERREAVRSASRTLQHALAEERRWRSQALPAPDRLLAVCRGLAAGLDANRADDATIVRLGHGASRSVHRVVGSGRSPLPVDLDDAPVGIAFGGGVVHHLEVEEPLADGVVELVAANLAVLGLSTGRRPFVVSPRVVEQRWVWLRDSSRVHAGRIAPPDLLEALGEGTSRIDGSAANAPTVVLDARADGAADLAHRWIGRSTGTLIWIGLAHPGVPARTVHLAPGHDASRTDTGHRFTMDTPPTHWFTDLTAALCRWSAAEVGRQGAAVPSLVTPQDVLPVDALPVVWARGPNLAVPVGRSADGDRILDLSVSGPHALVAGTTGSGKSEFLLGYLRGLFTLNSPTHATALLIDYKGGATFGALAGARHVVGVVTDLDAGLAERALIALRAEIRRRERVLADAGFSSYTAYAAAGSTGAPLPRLFVVVDEFRVLAEELPDFVSGLVRLAAVGRSLGMHLVLATQRPGGAVTPDMRANLDARVALRVRERSDSVDVIESAAAASIDRTTPGRAFVRTGGEAPVEFQSVLTTLPRPATADRERLHVHDLVTNEPLPTCPGCVAGGRSARTDLELFVEEVSQAARSLPEPFRPVPPPLPDVVDATERHCPAVTWPALDDAGPHTLDGGSEGLDGDRVVAVADLPHLQAQPVLGLPERGHIGIAGAPRSGLTSAAMRIAEVAARSGEGILWACPGPPSLAHSLLVAGRTFDVDQPQDVADMLTAFAGAGSGGGSTTLVIDGWEPLNETLMRINRGSGSEDMLALVRTAHTRGVRVVVTGGRGVLSSRLTPLLDLRLVMRQNDSTEYSLAGLRPAQIPRHMPPGRAVVLPHGHCVHFALPQAAGACRRSGEDPEAGCTASGAVVRENGDETSAA